MYILITANNCPNCKALKTKLTQMEIKFTEIKLNIKNTPAIISKLRTSGIFKTEMPILVKEIGDEWEEVKCE